MKAIRWIVIIFGVYVVLALALDGMIAAFQPQSGSTGVLRTFDADGAAHDKVLSVLDDDGQLWVESGHWFRGWYYRLRENPDVELVRDGKTLLYRAVPLATPEAERHVKELMKRRAGSGGYWAGRIMLLFAPIKPVRLDPGEAG